MPSPTSLSIISTTNAIVKTKLRSSNQSLFTKPSPCQKARAASVAMATPTVPHLKSLSMGWWSIAKMAVFTMMNTRMRALNVQCDTMLRTPVLHRVSRLGHTRCSTAITRDAAHIPAALHLTRHPFCLLRAAVMPERRRSDFVCLVKEPLREREAVTVVARAGARVIVNSELPPRCRLLRPTKPPRGVDGRPAGVPDKPAAWTRAVEPNRRGRVAEGRPSASTTRGVVATSPVGSRSGGAEFGAVGRRGCEVSPATGTVVAPLA